MIPTLNSPFEGLVSQLQSLPLWVKQVIYQQMKSDLESSITRSALDTLDRENLLQMWTPIVTKAGRGELEEPSGAVPAELSKLLYLSCYEKSVIFICMANSWNLEQCAELLLQGIERNLIVTPKSTVIEATILYLANRIRIGEYLVKIGRLEMDQLDQALRTQKYIQEALGEKTGLADVLINLGYINKQDSEGILFLKEESKKIFDMASASVTTSVQRAVTPQADMSPARPANTIHGAESNLASAQPALANPEARSTTTTPADKAAFTVVSAAQPEAMSSFVDQASTTSPLRTAAGSPTPAGHGAPVVTPGTWGLKQASAKVAEGPKNQRPKWFFGK
jgi:hypothetical protein